ncbi:MAG: hypothetical protein M1816_003357 [Peltula sp. TS41687]|nr:MAG: hypothetical protein M1816_003357 [Peltula sp. TS41687]
MNIQQPSQVPPQIDLAIQASSPFHRAIQAPPQAQPAIQALPQIRQAVQGLPPPPQPAAQTQQASEAQYILHLLPSDRDGCNCWEFLNRDGWILITYPFFLKTVQYHGDFLSKKQMMRRDSILTTHFNFGRVWDDRNKLLNKIMDEKAYLRIELVSFVTATYNEPFWQHWDLSVHEEVIKAANHLWIAQRNAMKHGYVIPKAAREGLKNSVNAFNKSLAMQKGLGKQLERLDELLMMTSATICRFTKFFIERDMPILASMTDVLIKEQANQGKKNKDVSSNPQGTRRSANGHELRYH